MKKSKFNLPKFTGVLSKPIETGIIIPLMNRAAWDEWSEQHHDVLHRQRIAKMPELARQLGIKFDHLDLKSHGDLVSFYGHLSALLAIRIGIPGFQEAKHKWEPELVAAVLVHCERRKGEQKIKSPRSRWSDFPVCLEAVRDLDPEMQRRANSKAAKARASQLRNRVSALRQKWKKDHADAQRKLTRNQKLRIVSQT